MTEILYHLKDFDIEADLNTIIKYHPASKAFLNKKTAMKYSKKVYLHIKGTIENKKFIPHSDYDYIAITNNILPDPSKRFTLLALVSNLIEFEWQRFKNYEMIPVLEELKLLLEIRKNDKYDSLYTKLALTEPNKLKPGKERLDVEAMKIVSKEPYENKQIVDLMINNRIDKLFSTDNSFYDFQYLDRSIHPNSIITLELVNKFLSELKYKSITFKATDFAKLISKTVIIFLKNEMDWKQGTVEITKGQGVIIYTLLMLFKHIDPTLINAHNTDTSKAKYVRTFLLNPEKMDKQEFIQLTGVKKSKSKRYNNQLLKYGRGSTSIDTKSK